ncbi:MAG: NADH-quinone oxidoreductase subunit N [Verrucomicrobiota bacterium]
MIPPIYLEIAVLAIGLFLLMYESFSNDRNKSMIAWLAITGLSSVLLVSFFIPAYDEAVQAALPYSQFYRADCFALFFKRIALLTTILVLVMSMEYKTVLRKFIFSSEPQAGLAEFYTLPVFACAGLMWMASAIDFVFIFVSLELVTISFYILVSYTRRNPASLEAGVKYLILGALSTGFLVYGITWIFGITGNTNLFALRVMLSGLTEVNVPLLFGMVLVLIALGFKIAAAPFQLWVPDVYQGAPTPVTAFLSVGSKAAGFIVLMRVLDAFMAAPVLRVKLIGLFVVLAAATLIYGNLAAMPQENMKRLLAYSSIGHAGYLLVGIACYGAIHAAMAIQFYLAAYLLMTMLAFMVMTVVSSHTGGDDIAHFNGLARRSPFLAFGMLVAMASLAGVPLTAGFLGKFLVFESAMQQHQYLLVGIGAVTVAAGFYYYLKVVRAMYWKEPANESRIPMSPVTGLAIIVLSAAILLLGVYPQPVFSMLKPAETTHVASR